jgi:hypothetical protein
MHNPLPDGFEWCPNGSLKIIGIVCSCRDCSPIPAPQVIDFDPLPHVNLCCPVGHCGSTKLEYSKLEGQTYYWECSECRWPIHSTIEMVRRRGSPEPVTRRCRLCDSEVTARSDRSSWGCICGFRTKASDTPFQSTGSEHSDGVWCKNTLLSNRQWRKQYWSRIPNTRQQEILDHVDVSEYYIDCLESTLQYIRTYALSY